MKLRGLIVATVVLLALVGALYWSEHRKPSEDASAKSSDAPQILKLDQGSITKLEIKKKGADPIALSKDSDSWKITAPKVYGADQSTVSSALSTLSALNSERLVEEKGADFKQYGLDPPSLEVDVTEKDNKTHRLLVGDDTPTGGSTYAALAGDPRLFTIASYNKSSVDKNINDLRDKRLLTVNSDKISRLELVRKKQTIEFGRNKNDWQILKPSPMRADGMQVSDLVRKLTEAKMDLSASDTDVKANESSFAKGTPVATVKLTSDAGTQELQIHKSKDSYYAKSSVVEGAYKADSDLGQAVEKDLESFRNKKLFDFGYADPGKVEMHNGAKAYYLAKGGSDWWSNGKKDDAASVESFVAKLRDLSATSFPESGFANPAIAISVTSQDGKQVEKVSIAKSAKDYIAKRENEPSLYELDSGVVEDLLKAADEIKPAPAK